MSDVPQLGFDLRTTPGYPSLVFVDLETSGANFANDRIIEIGIVEVGPDGAREWSTLINPEREITPFISGLTGIDNAMVADAPIFSSVAHDVLARLQGRLFVAHNARFDYSFLKREFLRAGLEFRASNLCTVKLSRKLCPEHHRHSLEALVGRYCIATEERHRALADARVLWQLWQLWHDRLPLETIRSAVDAIVGRFELPPQIDPGIVDDLPEAAGAYAFYGAEGELLLSRRSANLRQQVLAHFAPANISSHLVRSTQRIAWQESAGELGGRLHEIRFASPAPATASELCSWQLLQSDVQGDFRPRLVYSADIDFATTPDLYGLYAHPREATLGLRRLAEAHRLCYQVLGLGTGKPGEACVAYRQKNCRGACIGKESLPLHGARLLSALAKHRIQTWPYEGAVALVERDEFGMREDFHLFDAWRYLGTAQN